MSYFGSRYIVRDSHLLCGFGNIIQHPVAIYRTVWKHESRLKYKFSLQNELNEFEFISAPNVPIIPLEYSTITNFFYRIFDWKNYFPYRFSLLLRPLLVGLLILLLWLLLSLLVFTDAILSECKLLTIFTVLTNPIKPISSEWAQRTQLSIVQKYKLASSSTTMTAIVPINSLRICRRKAEEKKSNDE